MKYHFSSKTAKFHLLVFLSFYVGQWNPSVRWWCFSLAF